MQRFKDSRESCKVCDICYMLVVAEHQLIEVEKLYARAQNIPLDQPHTSERTIDKERKIYSDAFKTKLN